MNDKGSTSQPSINSVMSFITWVIVLHWTAGIACLVLGNGIRSLVAGVALMLFAALIMLSAALMDTSENIKARKVT